MARLDYQTTALFLSQLGVTPSGTPAEFDRLGRDLGEWFERGGGCREFVELHRALRAETRSLPEQAPDWRRAMTFEQRMAVLRRRYASP